jgi:hypothetical protein
VTDTTPTKTPFKLRATLKLWGALLTGEHAASIAELRAEVQALRDSYGIMRMAMLEWGKDTEDLERWSRQHLARIERLEAASTETLQTIFFPT